MCDTCFHLIKQTERLKRLIELGGQGRVSVSEAEAYLADLNQQIHNLKKSHEVPRVVRANLPVNYD